MGLRNGLSGLDCVTVSTAVLVRSLADTPKIFTKMYRSLSTSSSWPPLPQIGRAPTFEPAHLLRCHLHGPALSHRLWILLRLVAF